MIPTLEIKGLDAVKDLLKTLEKVAQGSRSVELRSHSRSDGNASNAEIMKFLEDSGREFRQVGSGETEQIAQAGAAEYQKRIDALAKRATKNTKSGARAAAFLSGGGEGSEKVAAQIRNGVLKATMDKYMDIVSDHIENQTGPDGAALQNPKLSEEYAKIKKRLVGFAEPIGKRSGQLLDNVNPDGVGSRNIKFTKQ